MQISYMKPIYQGGNQKGGTYSGGAPTTTDGGKGASSGKGKYSSQGGLPTIAGSPAFTL